LTGAAQSVTVPVMLLRHAGRSIAALVCQILTPDPSITVWAAPLRRWAAKREAMHRSPTIQQALPRAVKGKQKLGHYFLE